MTYEEAEEYLLAIPKFASKTNHDNLRGFLKLLGNPHQKTKAIHVAGTNGKGSACAFLKSILREADFHVGLFTSPHLVEMRERFQIDEEMIDRQEFVSLFCKVRQAVDEGMQQGLIHPNFFEFLFLMAACYFENHEVDFAIYETGLGGRLDATNVLQPELTIITEIGLDHMQYLGDTVEQIAGEKAGIMKPDTPCVALYDRPESGEVLKNRALELLIPIYFIRPEQIQIQKLDENGIDFAYSSPYDDVTGSKQEFHIKKTALYQLENASLAVEAARILLTHGLATGTPKPDDARKTMYSIIKSGLSKMTWPGRMQEILPDIFLDGAHNEPAIRAFVDTINTFYKDKKIILLFAVSSDKCYNEMIQILCGTIDFQEVIVTAIYGTRTTSVDQIEELFRKNGAERITVESDLKQAFLLAQEKKNDENRVFCVGSLYLVGSILELLH